MTGRAPARSALEELHAVITAEGGLLAESLHPRQANRTLPEVFGPLLATGERTRRDPHEYSLLVESILEGYLLHHGAGRIVEQPDPDLRLLAGDYLYAFGLARLASIGDLDAVEELADLISLCAQAHADSQREGRAAAPWQLTGALWALTVLAIATGPWPEQQHTKRQSRGDDSTAEQVLDAASRRASSLGVVSELERALIAFHHAVERSSSTK
jgi:hypothetical protein